MARQGSVPHACTHTSHAESSSIIGGWGGEEEEEGGGSKEGCVDV
jgi:hypothetical protein